MFVGSLFSGVGGFDLGFERAGMTVRWQVEIDKHCQSILRRHWPDAELYDDVTEVRGDGLPAVDVICGGFPCQDLSVAGRRKGLAGERSGLWFEFHRILAEARPEWVVIENVPGLLSSSRGRDFAVILSGLGKLGYLSAWRILDAQYFGVAQRRRRVFLVGHLGDGRAAEVLFEREGGGGGTTAGKEEGAELARDVAASLRSSGNGERGWIGEAEMGLCAFGGGNTSGAIRVSTALNTRERIDFDTETLICNTFNGYTGGVDDNDAQGKHLVVGRPNEACSGRRSEARGVPITFNWRSGGDVRLGITEDGVTALHSRQAPAVHHVGVRRLMPVETERLQGFPDGWSDGQADGTRYKQMGNAVCVPVAEWIGRRIMEVS